MALENWDSKFLVKEESLTQILQRPLKEVKDALPIEEELVSKSWVTGKTDGVRHNKTNHRICKFTSVISSFSK